MTSETGSVPPLQLSLPHPPKSPHWLRCQENNCMGLPESDSALLNSFTKADQLKFAAGGWFNKLIDIMVFHTIRDIYSSFHFPPSFLLPFFLLSRTTLTLLFSLCPLVSGILFLLFKGDHTSFFVPLYYFWWSNGMIYIYRHTLNPRRTQWLPQRQRRQGTSQQCQW